MAKYNPIAAFSQNAGLLQQHFLDTHTANSYNNPCAEVAQLVEQRTENPRVPSSILGLGTTRLQVLMKGRGLIFCSSRSGGIGRRDSLKNC